MIQAARGLELAHKRGVIDRDIKPANLLPDSEGIVNILDMGLARFSDSADAATQAELTGTGTIMGTVDYMSPEQALSTKSADARSEIYSLGITLYYLLTAKPAYAADSIMARMMAHASQPIPSLQDGLPDIPADVQSIFAKMVAKKPDDRYQTMTEVPVDLESCLNSNAGASLNSVMEHSAAGLSAFLGSLSAQGDSSTGTAPTVIEAIRTAVAETDQTLISRPTSDTIGDAAKLK